MLRSIALNSPPIIIIVKINSADFTQCTARPIIIAMQVAKITMINAVAIASISDDIYPAFLLNSFVWSILISPSLKNHLFFFVSL